jgi:hypothetical protein
MVFYRQCLLAKGRIQQISWIPEPLAVKGKTVDLGKRHEDPAWLVVLVYDMRKSEDHLLTHERDYLDRRSRTDS